MFHQWRLVKRSIDTAKVDWNGVEEAAKTRFLAETNLAELPPFLDLLRARTLDRILHEETAEEDAVLRDLLQRRNRSILAHGLDPIGERAARRFLEYVDAMIDEPEARQLAEHITLRGL